MLQPPDSQARKPTANCLMSSHLAIRSSRPIFWPILLGATLIFASGWGYAPAAPRIDWIDVHTMAHFFVFGLLATLILRCFGASRARPHALIATFTLTVFFGAADELRQAFNPVRVFSFHDGLVDALGAAVAITAYTCWPAYRRLLEWKVFSRRSDPETHTGAPRRNSTVLKLRPAAEVVKN